MERKKFIVLGGLLGVVISGLTGWEIYSNLHTFIFLVLALIAIPAGFIVGAGIGFMLSFLESGKFRNLLTGAAIGAFVGLALAVQSLLTAQFTFWTLLVAGLIALACLIFGGVYGHILFKAEEALWDDQQWAWRGSLFGSLLFGTIAYSLSNEISLLGMGYIVVAQVAGLIVGAIAGGICYALQESRWIFAIALTIGCPLVAGFASYLAPDPEFSIISNIVSGIIFGLIAGLVFGFLGNLVWIVLQLENKLNQMNKKIVLLQDAYDSHLQFLHNEEPKGEVK